MLSYDAMVKDLETAIHQFAKRQMTWFRGMERRGVKINWIDGELPMEKKVEKIIGLLAQPHPPTPPMNRDRL
jgi:tRNA dimethylallyltransferase